MSERVVYVVDSEGDRRSCCWLFCVGPVVWELVGAEFGMWARSSSNICANAETRSACCCRQAWELLREKSSSAYAMAWAIGSSSVQRWSVSARRRILYTAFQPNGLATSPCRTPLADGKRMSAAPKAWRRWRPASPVWSYACCEMGSRTVVVQSRLSCMRKKAHSGGTPSRVQVNCRAGLLILSNARRMSQEETRQAV